MDLTIAFQKIGIDAAALCRAWEAYKQVFSDYMDAVIEALEPAAKALSEAFSIDIFTPPPSLDSERVEKFLKRAEDICPKQAGTYRQKEKKSLRGLLRYEPNYYNYIPKIPRNLPYQRRAFV